MSVARGAKAIVDDEAGDAVLREIVGVSNPFVVDALVVAPTSEDYEGGAVCVSLGENAFDIGGSMSGAAGKYSGDGCHFGDIPCSASIQLDRDRFRFVCKEFDDL